MPEVEGSSPIKIFFFIFFLIFAQEIFRDLHVCRRKNKHVLMYYAPVKWRGLYGDTTTMQELLLKTCKSSARKKRSLE